MKVDFGKVMMHQKSEYYIKIGKAIEKESGMHWLQESKLKKNKYVVMLLLTAVIFSFYVLAKGENESIVWQKDEKKVAITFDDGPDAKTTALLLDGLKARGVRASFFVIGEKAEQNPKLILRMKKEGHLIGNHTYSHVQLNALSINQACSQVKAANDVIEGITGREVIYLRPPYGEWNHKKDCPQDMIAVYWDVDPLDWKRTDTGQIAADILRQVKPGDIILLHDIYETSVQAAFLVIDELYRQGYEFVTVDELMFV